MKQAATLCEKQCRGLFAETGDCLKAAMFRHGLPQLSIGRITAGLRPIG